jgi:hypothetical protein
MVINMKTAKRGGRADRGRAQKSKFAKFEIKKLQKSNFRNFHHKVFPEINREIVSRKIVFLFSRSTARLSLLRLLVPHSQCARCTFNASKQCPYEATTFYLAEQPRSEERTQEDTMNPMRRSPSLLVDMS